MTLTNQKVELLAQTDGTATFEQGVALYSALARAIENDSEVKLSLHNAPAMSSSFMHGSFGRLIEVFGAKLVKERLKLTDYVPSQALRIQEYMETYLH
jgi:hypothetical protein